MLNFFRNAEENKNEEARTCKPLNKGTIGADKRKKSEPEKEIDHKKAEGNEYIAHHPNGGPPRSSGCDLFPDLIIRFYVHVCMRREQIRQAMALAMDVGI